MDVETIEDKQNSVLHRKEMKVKISDYSATPSNEQIKEQLKAKLGLNELTMVLEKSKQQFGKNEVICQIKVYENEKYREKYELKKNVKKEGNTEEEKETAPAKEEKKAEKKEEVKKNE